MSAPLPAPAHAKLVKLAGLFTSDYDGERANAARMATDLLRQHRLTWAEVLTPSGLCPVCAARHAEREPPRHEPNDRDWTRDGWQEVLWRCALNADLLTDWEMRFLDSLQRRRRPPTPRQQDVLDGIADRIWEAGQ